MRLDGVGSRAFKRCLLLSFHVAYDGSLVVAELVSDFQETWLGLVIKSKEGTCWSIFVRI